MKNIHKEAIISNISVICVIILLIIARSIIPSEIIHGIITGIIIASIIQIIFANSVLLYFTKKKVSQDYITIHLKTANNHNIIMGKEYPVIKTYRNKKKEKLYCVYNETKEKTFIHPSVTKQITKKEPKYELY